VREKVLEQARRAEKGPEPLICSSLLALRPPLIFISPPNKPNSAGLVEKYYCELSEPLFCLMAQAKSWSFILARVAVKGSGGLQRAPNLIYHSLDFLNSLESYLHISTVFYLGGHSIMYGRWVFLLRKAVLVKMHCGVYWQRRETSDNKLEFKVLSVA
jgi:hypothetical protein